MLAKLNIIVDAAGARRALGAFQRQVASTGRFVQARAGAMAGAFSGVASSIFGLRGAMAGLGLGLLTRSIVATTLEVERLKIGLNSMTNDMGKTSKRFNELRKFSNELGVDFMTTAGAFKSFGVATEAAGIKAKETERIFRSFITAGAAMQMTNDEMKGSLLAVSQMFSKGKVSAEELRGQLGERLPPAFALAAQSMGMTTAELDKALASGNILATDMVPKLATLLEEKFGEGAKSASRSATAQFNRFTNAMNDLKVAIGNSGLVDALARLSTKITAFVRSGELGKWIHSSMLGFAQFLRGVADLSATFNAITGGLGAVYNSMADMFNKMDKFAGGMITEMGLIGFILMGGKRGGFIGVMLALLAGAADMLIKFVQQTMRDMSTAAAAGLPGSIGVATAPSFEQNAESFAEKYILGPSTKATPQSYHKKMTGQGMTMQADGTYASGERFNSSVPGMESLHSSFTSIAKSMQSQLDDRANGAYTVTGTINKVINSIYEAAGLTPSGARGGMPSFTPSGVGPAGQGDTDYGLAEAMERLAEEFRKQNETISTGASGVSSFGTGGGETKGTLTLMQKFLDSDFAGGVKEAFGTMKNAALDFRQLGLDVVNKGFGFLDSAIDGFISGTKVSFKSFVAEMLAMLAKLMVKMMLFKALAGMGGSFAKFGNFLQNGPTAQAAGGGAMMGNRGYLVGERGPEMFYPRTGGHMVPNHGLAGGGGVTIYNNYDFSNADESVAARLAQTAETIKNETFMRVFGAIEQGGRYAKASGRR